MSTKFGLFEMLITSRKHKQPFFYVIPKQKRKINSTQVRTYEITFSFKFNFCAKKLLLLVHSKLDVDYCKYKQDINQEGPKKSAVFYLFFFCAKMSLDREFFLQLFICTVSLCAVMNSAFHTAKYRVCLILY
jgi:hypothetical protein